MLTCFTFASLQSVVEFLVCTFGSSKSTQYRDGMHLADQLHAWIHYSDSTSLVLSKGYPGSVLIS